MLRSASLHLLASLSLLAACSAGVDGAADLGADAGAGADVTVELDVVFDVSSDVGDGCERRSATLDSDMDGLPDVVEDADLDCIVDEGETDPRNPDSDADGLSDGDEDLDRNGYFSPGEFDPLDADTDGNGVIDGDEPLARVCSASFFDRLTGTRVALGDNALVFVPDGVTVRPWTADAVTLIEPGQGDGAVLGRVDEIELDSVAARVESVLVELDVAFSLRARQARTLGVVYEWDIFVEAPVSAVQLAERIGVSLGLGTDGTQPGAEAPVASARLAITLNARGEHSVDVSIVIAAPERFALWREHVATAMVADSPTARVGLACSEIDFVAPPDVDLIIVGDAAAATDAVTNAIGEFMTRRALATAATRVWVVSTSAHLEVGALPIQPIQSLREIDEALSSLSSSSTDPRWWENALAVAGVVDAIDSDAVKIVLLLASREDTAFRAGTTLGRDGAATLPALGDGELRVALTEYYVRALGELGVAVVAAAPSESALIDECGAALAAGYPVGVGLDAGHSFADVTLAANGDFVDICNRDFASALSRSLDFIVPTGPWAALDEAPVGGGLWIADDSGLLSEGSYRVVLGWPDGSPELRLDAGREASDLPVSWLSWIPSGDSSLRSRSR